MTANMKSRSGDGLKTTSLHDLHVSLAAEMAPAAGYDMPMSYSAGVSREHLHTREWAGLFDVSHMGQLVIEADAHDAAARALEALAPGDFLGLPPGGMRYSQLLNDAGGIIDDLLITRLDGPEGAAQLILVVNAARREADHAFISGRLPEGVRLTALDDKALLSLQGPRAVDVLARHAPGVASLTFMTALSTQFDGLDCRISRSGYTGEDGFELSMNAGDAEEITRVLLDEENVLPIGLGARDTLRLEAGLCLYGRELDETTSPVEAGLAWSIPKRRREEGGFPGTERILRELRDGPRRKRVGLIMDGDEAPRASAAICAMSGQPVGSVTSAAYSPVLKRGVAMGYVDKAHAVKDAPLLIAFDGELRSARIASLPFVPNSYIRRINQSSV
ncbi:MAG: glycine cleavage system aminomethyltransferase GcvT [Hyphomicrobiales bacterium]|nr:glycine cleavage system aminomethyltransferase GcvT [Hyphomicrobiales bacterium]